MNAFDLADKLRIQYGFPGDDDAPIAVLARALVDKNSNPTLIADDLVTTLTNLLGSAGAAAAISTLITGTDLTAAGVLTTLATNVGAHDTQGIALLAALLATTGAGAAILADLPGSYLGSADGLGQLRVARGTFNPSANSGERTIAPHAFGSQIPDKSIIVGGFVQVNTLFDSSDHTGSVALSIEGADDIIAAAAINGAPFSSTGIKAIVPKANTPESTAVALTAARTLTATVTTKALTAGKLTAFLYYVVGA